MGRGGGGVCTPRPPTAVKPVSSPPSPPSPPPLLAFAAMERKFSLDVKGGGGVGRGANENFLYMETKTGRETFSFSKIIFSSPLR